MPQFTDQTYYDTPWLDQLTPMDKAILLTRQWVGKTPECRLLRLWDVPPTVGESHLVAAHWVEVRGGQIRWRSWRCFTAPDGALPYEGIQGLPLWLITKVWEFLSRQEE